MAGIPTQEEEEARPNPQDLSAYIGKFSSPNPIFHRIQILIVSEFRRSASSPSLCQPLYLAFKMCSIIIMSLTPPPPQARRKACKLSLTPLLSISFFLHGRADGWSNTASPTTPPYSYIFHLVRSTLKYPLSLGSHYFLLCTTLFYSITLQLSYIVELFDTLSNVLLLFRFKPIMYAKSLKKMFIAMHTPCGRETAPVFIIS